MTEIRNIKVTIEEKNLIINNGADKLPLNPTSQGFSGQSVRKQLAQAVTGARGSVLSLMIEKFSIIEDFSNTVLLVEVKAVGDDLTFIYADGREFKFPLDVITNGLVKFVNDKAPDENGRVVINVDDISELRDFITSTTTELFRIDFEFRKHENNTDNPHQVTKTQVGLSNVLDIEQASKVEFDEHKNNLNNPHNVNAEQINTYEKQVIDNKIEQAVTSLMKYKGSVPYKEDLPTTGNVIGDFYNVSIDGINYAWDGEKWDMVGGFTDVRLFEVSGSNVVETLRDGFDFTFTSDLNSMILTIPSNVAHGYFSGFNFKTRNYTIGITFVNESSMPLKLFKFNKELSSIHLNPNKIVNASLHSDGFNIYCYYIEV